MNRLTVSRVAPKQLDVSIRKSFLRAALHLDSLCTKSPDVQSVITSPRAATLCGLAGASLLAATLIGCEAPREPNAMGTAEQNTATETAVDTIPNSSPSLEVPLPSSGTTLEPQTESAAINPENKAAAGDEQLMQTLNPSADAAWGDWAVETATMNGESMPRDVAATISLFIDATTYIANVGGQVDKGTVAIRRSTTPMELDITGAEGPNAGKTILAIFEQPDANTLIVCYSFNQSARPTEFSSTAENGQFLVKYNRKGLN